MAEKPVIAPYRLDKREKFTRFFNSFVSMHTGIILLMLVMAASFVGTFIPMGRENLVLGDVYHTWWFRALLGLLCVNIAACSTRRLPELWRSTVSVPDLASNNIRNMPLYRSIRAAHPAEQIIEKLEVLLNGQGYRIRRLKQGERLGLYAVRGRMAPWGTLTVHLSVLIIAAGALYGNLFGFSEDIALPVGSSVEISGSKYPGVGQPFTLRLNSFNTEYYSDGTVSDWISDISVDNSGREVLSKQVMVNQPLTYNGIMVYQSSFGTAVQTKLIASDGSLVKEASISENELLEAGGIVVRPVRYIPDFNPMSPMVSNSANPFNPHVLYIVYDHGREVNWGAAKLGESISLGRNRGSVIFTAAQPFSGLQVKYDPGIPAVWFGFAMMTAGFFISLYSKRLQFCLKIDQEQGRISLIELGGKGSRTAFESIYESLIKRVPAIENGFRREK